MALFAYASCLCFQLVTCYVIARCSREDVVDGLVSFYAGEAEVQALELV